MKRVLISAAVVALAITGVTQASAAPAVTKITGGGQTLVPTTGGAGDTVGFNAQVDDAGNVKGQFQYVDRTGGTGQGQTVQHGTVTCATVFTRPDGGGAGGVAVFGGLLRDGVTPFRVDVTDDGQGNKGSDMILVQTGDAARDGSDDGEDRDLCDQEDEDSLDLSRGNVTIHKTK